MTQTLLLFLVQSRLFALLIMKFELSDLLFLPFLLVTAVAMRQFRVLAAALLLPPTANGLALFRVVTAIPVVRCLIHMLTGAVVLVATGLLQKLVLAMFAMKQQGLRLVCTFLLFMKSAASTMKQPLVLTTLVPRPKEQSSPHALLPLQFALQVSPVRNLPSALVGLQNLEHAFFLKFVGLPTMAITHCGTSALARFPSIIIVLSRNLMAEPLLALAAARIGARAAFRRPLTLVWEMNLFVLLQKQNEV